MKKTDRDEPAYEKPPSEEDIPEEDRYRFGLLIRAHTSTRYRYQE